MAWAATVVTLAYLATYLGLVGMAGCTAVRHPDDDMRRSARKVLRMLIGRRK